MGLNNLDPPKITIDETSIFNPLPTSNLSNLTAVLIRDSVNDDSSHNSKQTKVLIKPIVTNDAPMSPENNILQSIESNKLAGDLLNNNSYRSDGLSAIIKSSADPVQDSVAVNDEATSNKNKLLVANNFMHEMDSSAFLIYSESAEPQNIPETLPHSKSNISNNNKEKNSLRFEEFIKQELCRLETEFAAEYGDDSLAQIAVISRSIS